MAHRRAGRRPAQAGARWWRRLRQPRCRYVRDGRIPVLVAGLAAWSRSRSCYCHGGDRARRARVDRRLSACAVGVWPAASKFTGAPRCRGNPPPQRSVIVGVGPPLYVGRQSRPSSRRGAGATANGACCNGRGRPDRLRVDGRVRAAKTHTDGRAMGTSKGVEATSFSEQAPAARRIRARGSLTLRAFWRGCSRCRRRGREVHGRPPPGAGGNPPQRGRHCRSGAPSPSALAR